MDEDTPIDAKILSGAIENAQKQVESRNFQTRKNVLEYDDVMNTQREVIYKQRRQVLDGENLRPPSRTCSTAGSRNAVHGHLGEHKHMTAEDWREATAQFRGLFLPPERAPVHRRGAASSTSADGLVDLLKERARTSTPPRRRSWASPSCGSWSGS